MIMEIYKNSWTQQSNSDGYCCELTDGDVSHKNAIKINRTNNLH